MLDFSRKVPSIHTISGRRTNKKNGFTADQIINESLDLGEFGGNTAPYKKGMKARPLLGKPPKTIWRRPRRRRARLMIS